MLEDDAITREGVRGRIEIHRGDRVPVRRFVMVEHDVAAVGGEHGHLGVVDVPTARVDRLARRGVEQARGARADHAGVVAGHGGEWEQLRFVGAARRHEHRAVGIDGRETRFVEVLCQRGRLRRRLAAHVVRGAGVRTVGILMIRRDHALAVGRHGVAADTRSGRKVSIDGQVRRHRAALVVDAHDRAVVACDRRVVSVVVDRALQCALRDAPVLLERPAHDATCRCRQSDAERIGRTITVFAGLLPHLLRHAEACRIGAFETAVIFEVVGREVKVDRFGRAGLRLPLQHRRQDPQRKHGVVVGVEDLHRWLDHAARFQRIDGGCVERAGTVVDHDARCLPGAASAIRGATSAAPSAGQAALTRDRAATPAAVASAGGAASERQRDAARGDQSCCRYEVSHTDAMEPSVRLITKSYCMQLCTRAASRSHIGTVH